MAVLSLVACSDDDPQCKRNTDCDVAKGEVCQKGKCIDNPFALVSTDSGNTSATRDTSSTVVSTQPEETSNPTDTADTDTTDTTVSTSTVTQDGACISNSQCDDGNDCTADFCNTSVSPSVCDTKPRLDGVVCGEDDPCFGRAICQSGECVAVSPPCPEKIEEDQCVRYETQCDPDGMPMCTYLEIPINEAGACFNGDPCKRGVCTAGECVGAEMPCTGVQNACTALACQATGTSIDDFECAYSLAPDGQYCTLNAAESACYSTETSPDFILGYCYGNGVTADCIPSDSRKCYDPDNPNICESFACVPEDGSCEDLAPIDVSIHVSCGDNVFLEAADFLTRDYYVYSGGTCDRYDVRGKEVALTVNLSGSADVTFTVTNNGGQDILLNHLSDMCDPGTCQSNAFETLTVSGMTAGDAILVEAGIGNPPAEIELSVTCENIIE